MNSWGVRAAAAFAAGAAGQATAVLRRVPGASVLPLLTARYDPDPSPVLRTARGTTGAPVAVVVHCHYPDVLPGLLAALEVIPEDFDLLITATSELSVPPDVPAHATALRIHRVSNRGRDILPLVRLVNAGLLDGYEVICKVHTKKSVWRREGGRFTGDGAAWRDALVAGILGSPGLVGAVLGAFRSDPDLMMVTAPGQVLGPRYWGANLPLVRALGRRGGVAIRPAALRFAAGSMYWVRGDVLRRLGALRLCSAHFDSERGQDDGTTAHAVERYLGYLATAMGRLVTADVIHAGS